MRMENEENPRIGQQRDDGETIDDGAPVVAPSSPQFPAEKTHNVTS